METFPIRPKSLSPHPTPDSIPDTSFIRSWLELAADKAKTAEYGISIRSAIVTTALQSCDQIDQIIAKADSLPVDAKEAAWPKFNKCSQDIKFLQGLLLNPKDLFNPVDIKPKTKPVSASLNDAENWEIYRRELKNRLDVLLRFLNYLKGGTSRRVLSPRDQQHDDAAMMHSLSSLLTQESSGLPGHASDAITELKNALSTIRPAAHRDGIVPAIKGTWIVCAAAWESKSGADAKRHRFLRSEVVWDAVKSFSGVLRRDSSSCFQAAYNNLKDVLAVRFFTASAATQSFLNVIKAARGVGRPFMDLNNLLVGHCGALADLHNKAELGLILANNTVVANAFKSAVDAAEAAAVWKEDPRNKDTVYAAFNKAFDSLKALFPVYDSTKLTGWDEAKNNASAGDIKRFDQLKAIPSGKHSTGALPTSRVVTVHIKDVATGNAKAVRLPGSTKLDILIWREGHQFIGAMEAGRPLALGKTIAELNLDGKAIELRTTSGSSLSAKPGATFAIRVDVGDPTPEKDIQRFLRIVYLLAERVLQTARDTHAYHLLGVTIARQALRLVLLLNAAVAEDGPTQEQLDERVKLRNQIVHLEAEMREWGSESGEIREGGVNIPIADQPRVLSFDSGGPQGKTGKLRGSEHEVPMKAARGQLMLHPNLGNQYERTRQVMTINKQYDIFFAARFYYVPNPLVSTKFAMLLEYDNKTLASRKVDIPSSLMPGPPPADTVAPEARQLAAHRRDIGRQRPRTPLLANI